MPAIDSGYLKSALVRSMASAMTAINGGDQIVVGVNKWTEGLPSPLLGGDDGGVFHARRRPPSPRPSGPAWRRPWSRRDDARATAALGALKAAARDGGNMMEPSIECALARVTTGEWAGALRKVFGEYRPSTGVEGQRLGLAGDRVEALRARVAGPWPTPWAAGPRSSSASPASTATPTAPRSSRSSARHVGFDVVYSGIRLAPTRSWPVRGRGGRRPHRASVLSGSHVELARSSSTAARRGGAGDAPRGGRRHHPARATCASSTALGVERVFTPADYELIDIMESITDVIEERRAA